MPRVKLSPYIRNLQKLEDELDELWDGREMLSPLREMYAWDIYEEDGKLIAKTALPNFNKDEIKVSVSDGVLEVVADHQEKEEEEGKNRHYLLRESHDHYSRRVALPKGVNESKAEASFRDANLTITMPYAPAKQPKSIEVK